MDRACLDELGFASRDEALRFLKRLWREEPTPCPFCGAPLELLHRRAKRDSSDWQCRLCDKAFRTIHLLDELNERLPN